MNKYVVYNGVSLSNEIINYSESIIRKTVNNKLRVFLSNPIYKGRWIECKPEIVIYKEVNK